MRYALTWVPEILRNAGLTVHESDGWKSRGHGDMREVHGVMCHHTAGPATGEIPSINLLVDGRQNLPGPLAHLGLGRQGTYYMIAAGRTYHAGRGEWQGVSSGNYHLIGIEAENQGIPTDLWPEVQIEAYIRGVAAILNHIYRSPAKSIMCCGHKEYATPAGRKIDPLFDMDEFRAQVANVMEDQDHPIEPIPMPAPSTPKRTTLRRGDRGDMVGYLQLKLKIHADNIFGPMTEATVKQIQIENGLVADGIVGHLTWVAIEPGNR